LIDSRKISAGRPPLTDADSTVYVEFQEALVLFAEIKGLSVSAARDELRNRSGLESALARPKHAARYANADLAEQASTLLWGIAENQPFLDGNKRIALVVMLTFLELNGCTVDLSEDERVELMYEIAEGRTVEDVTQRIRAHLIPSPPIDEGAQE
jgi:death-on-curing protein